jgi:hypothetical protein
MIAWDQAWSSRATIAVEAEGLVTCMTLAWFHALDLSIYCTVAVGSRSDLRSARVANNMPSLVA